jgi:hypothetical protein
LVLLAPNWSDSTPLTDALTSLGLPQVPVPEVNGVVAISFALGLKRRRRSLHISI